MTSLARRAFVGASQRKLGKIMVKCRWLPCGRAMARGAEFPIQATMHIDIFMAIKASSRRAAVLIVYVASAAFGLFVYPS